MVIHQINRRDEIYRYRMKIKVLVKLTYFHLFPLRHYK